MSIKALPLLILSFILYNAIVFLAGDAANPHLVFNSQIFDLNMPTGGHWVFTLGDLVLVISLVLLCLELIKATYTRGAVLTDHALSMVLFVVCIVEFLLVPKASTSLFFLITFITAIDVIAGAIIGIRTARRDFGFAGGAG